MQKAIASTRMTAPDTWLTLVKDERLISHNAIVGIGTIVAGISGVAFQSLVSHRLRPDNYGAVFAVLSVVTLVALPATSFTLLMARQTSRDRASGQHAVSAAMLRGANRSIMLAGSAVAALLVLGSPLLVQLFGIPLELLLAAAVGVPFAIGLPLLLGELQGEQRFLAFSIVSIGQAGLKLVGAMALGPLWGSLGIVMGVSLASVVVYFIALRSVRRKLSIRSSLPWWRPSAGYLAVVLPSTLALGVLLSSDVLIVKHYFPTRVAGEYAAVAALGRAIFWGASGVAAVLFPKMVFRVTTGRSAHRLVTFSLLLVGLGGLAGLALLSFAARWLVNAFAGGSYLEATIYLPWYAVGMVFLGIAAVLISFHQSRGRTGFLFLLIPLSVLEPVLLVAFHQSLWAEVQVVDGSMALLVVALGALYLIQNGTRFSGRIEVSLLGVTRAQVAGEGIDS